jgi:hypothetical protein
MSSNATSEPVPGKTGGATSFPAEATHPLTAATPGLEAAAVVRGQTVRTATAQAGAPKPAAGWVPFQGDKPHAAETENDSPSPMAPPPGELITAGSETDSYGFKSVIPTPQSEPAEWDDRPIHGFEDVETRLEPRPGEDIGPTPSFMRHQRSNPTGSAPARGWQIGACCLVLLLLVQFSLAWRDKLAARLPGLEPVLAKACVPFACQVAAPRDIAALILDGSNLNQRSGASGYELVVALRNRSSAGVMWPSFELTLTDSQGQPLIRRVLTPQEFGVRDLRVGPGADVSLQTVLDVSDRRVAGYTVEIFYP